MQSLGFGARLGMALSLPFKVLFDGTFAARIKGLDEPELPAPALAPAVEVAEQKAERDESAGLQLLTILQREGRFVDFLNDDLSGASDADIGAAARVVHEGCVRGLKDYVDFAPVRTENEGSRVELPAGFDPLRTRVTGKVSGEPPYSGTLAHHGWCATRFSLPSLSEEHDPSILAPAEVELCARNALRWVSISVPPTARLRARAWTVKMSPKR